MKRDFGSEKIYSHETTKEQQRKSWQQLSYTTTRASRTHKSGSSTMKDPKKVHIA
jgi:hypothetical protein